MRKIVFVFSELGHFVTGNVEFVRLNLNELADLSKT